MDYLKCGLCDSQFDHLNHLPHSLPICGHTLCERCLNQFAGRLQCPYDDTLYTGKLDAFPINQNILKLVGKPQTTRLKSPSVVEQRRVDLNQLLTPPNFLDDILNSKHSKQGQLTNHHDLSKQISELQLQLTNQIKNKFNDLIARLTQRQFIVLEELNQAMQEVRNAKVKDISNSITLEFQLQMDALVPKFGTIRKNFEYHFNTEPSEFVTFSKSDSVETLRISPSRRIFDPPSPIVIKKLIPKGSPLVDYITKLQQGLTIEIVNLKKQNLTDLEASQLAQALAVTKSNIRVIKLSRNQISDAGFIQLLDSLKHNKTIKTMNLNHNRITEISLDYIIKLYKNEKNNYLQQIYFKGTVITQLHTAYIRHIQKLGIIIYI